MQFSIPSTSWVLGIKLRWFRSVASFLYCRAILETLFSVPPFEPSCGLDPFRGYRCGLAIGHQAALTSESPLQYPRAFLLCSRPQHFLLRIREGQTHKQRLCTQYSCDRPISKYPERSGSSTEPENLVFTPRQLLPAQRVPSQRKDYRVLGVEACASGCSSHLPA